MNFFNLRSLKKYTVSALLSILITLVLFGIISIVFSFFPPKEWLLNATGKYSTYLTVFLSSFLCARSNEGHGLAVGVISSVFCLVILLFIGCIVFSSGGFLGSFMHLLPISALVGALGGVIGINSK